MASQYHPQQPLPSELEITIVSAKHLKNVNWKSGELKPYCVFWIDPARRLSTKSDDSGSTRPVWNESFCFLLPDYPSSSSYLTLEVLHSNASETLKPLVGTLVIAINELPNPNDSNRVRTYELKRPSGRQQGKIRVKIGIRERPLPPPPSPHHHRQDYQFAPPHNYYYGRPTAPPQPIPLDYGRFPSVPPPSASASPYAPSYPLPMYYSGYYSSSSSAPPPPPRPSFYGGPPSVPSEAFPPPYDPRQKIPDDKGTAFATNMAVGVAAGALGGLVLDDKLKFEENSVSQKPEKDFPRSIRDDYSDYRADY